MRFLFSSPSTEISCLRRSTLGQDSRATASSQTAEYDGLPFTADLERIERVGLRQMMHACQGGHVVFDEIPRSTLSTRVAVIAGFRSA